MELTSSSSLNLLHVVVHRRKRRSDFCRKGSVLFWLPSASPFLLRRTKTAFFLDGRGPTSSGRLYIGDTLACCSRFFLRPHFGDLELTESKKNGFPEMNGHIKKTQRCAKLKVQQKRVTKCVASNCHRFTFNTMERRHGHARASTIMKY